MRSAGAADAPAGNKVAIVPPGRCDTAAPAHHIAHVASTLGYKARTITSTSMVPDLILTINSLTVAAMAVCSVQPATLARAAEMQRRFKSSVLCLPLHSASDPAVQDLLGEALAGPQGPAGGNSLVASFAAPGEDACARALEAAEQLAGGLADADAWAKQQAGHAGPPEADTLAGQRAEALTGPEAGDAALDALLGVLAQLPASCSSCAYDVAGLACFGGLAGVMAAQPHDLAACTGMSPQLAHQLAEFWQVPGATSG